MVSPMRVRKTAEARKVEIIEAALRLSDKLGPERLTTEAVADAVGLTQPGIFRHFPKKQALWEAVAAHIGAMQEARWTRSQSGEAGTLDQSCALIVTPLQLLHSVSDIQAKTGRASCRARAC